MSRFLEAYMVVLTADGGRRKATRHPVNVPLDLVTGHMERIGDRDLHNLWRDVTHERTRRANGFPELLAKKTEEAPAPRPAWSLASTQHRGDS